MNWAVYPSKNSKIRFKTMPESYSWAMKPFWVPDECLVNTPLQYVLYNTYVGWTLPRPLALLFKLIIKNTDKWRNHEWLAFRREITKPGFWANFCFTGRKRGRCKDIRANVRLPQDVFRTYTGNLSLRFKTKWPDIIQFLFSTCRSVLDWSTCYGVDIQHFLLNIYHNTRN